MNFEYSFKNDVLIHFWHW